MCGICGIWRPEDLGRDQASESSFSRLQSDLRQMARTIAYRGPDDEGTYENGAISLASRRLSIIDLDHGRQPISNEDGSLWLVFNGEIYNYPELRKRLQERGHCLRTETDTEVIVHLYEEEGVACVKHLRGMFAFALWDEKRQRLFIARDPLGQKPLYYTWHEGAFLFASEIKALLQPAGVTPRLNTLAMHHYITLRCIPAQMTLFKGIHKLPAAHFMVLDNARLRVQKYWDLRYVPKRRGSEEEIRQELEQLLLQTVESHMLSDAPIGAFLSGGIDSSLVVAMMASLSHKPVKTFSVGVKEAGFDELPYARMVAERYATEHHEMIVEPDLVQSLPKMIWHMDEPVDPFAFGVYSVSGLAAKHVKVVLGGDGGDEIFAGYDRYLGHRLVDYYALVPGLLRRQVFSRIIRRLPDDFSYNNPVQKLRWLDTMADTEPSVRYAQSASFLRFNHAHKEQLYTPDLWAELSGFDSLEELITFYEANNAQHPVDKMLYTDVRTRLPDHLLMIADRMTMAHSLEGRSPYVDQKVVEFVAGVPANLKLHGRTLKHIQREVARNYLPRELVERPKKGFGFPLAYWFQNELQPLLRNVFDHSSLVQAGYLRADGLTTLLQEHSSGQIDHNYRLWLLLNMELWYQLFIEGKSQSDLEAQLATSLAE